ncbi:MAG: ANTAR domain-containing protein [Antricoccus sp.]
MNVRQSWSYLIDAAAQNQVTVPESLLEAAVNAGAALAPHSVACSITQIQRDGYRTPAWSSDAALQLDAAQYRSDRGPCVSAAEHGTEYHVPVISTDDRYHELALVAGRLNVLSSLSMPVQGVATPTALNLYSAVEADLENSRVLGAARLLARCLSAGMSGNGDQSTMVRTHPEATERRNRVNRAIAILIDQNATSREIAFETMVNHSRQKSVTMAEVANFVIATVKERGDRDGSN